MTHELENFTYSSKFLGKAGQKFLWNLRRDNTLMCPNSHEAPLWELKFASRDLIRLFPNPIDNETHKYYVPTPIIAGVDLDVYRNNSRNFRGQSILEIYNQSSFALPNSKIRTLLTGKEMEHHPEIIALTLFTKYQLDKLLSISMIYKYPGLPIPAKLCWDIVKPGYKWKDAFPRGEWFRDITDGDLLAYFDALESAKIFRRSR